MADQVLLQCTRAGGKLRVRILSPGYFRDANCQFPRSIRSDGQLYSVAPRSVRLVQSASGRNFYRVSQPIKLLDAVDEHNESEGDGDNCDSNRDSSSDTNDGWNRATRLKGSTPRSTRTRTKASATTMTSSKDKPAAGKKRRVRPDEKPRAVFDHQDEPDCVVCLDVAKEQIFVPCGHFCMCAGCIQQLCRPKKCPLCREPIKSTILPSEL